MDRHILKNLSDISSAIDEINSFTERFGRQYDVFINDTLFFRGVQMNIAIMGEAMTRILKVLPDIPITSARKIVDTRNYVIHAYDSLRPEILWNIVINHLPVLKNEVEQLLKQYQT